MAQKGESWGEGHREGEKHFYNKDFGKKIVWNSFQVGYELQSLIRSFKPRTAKYLEFELITWNGRRRRTRRERLSPARPRAAVLLVLLSLLMCLSCDLGGGAGRVSLAKRGQSYGQFCSENVVTVQDQQRPCSASENRSKKRFSTAVLLLWCRQTWIQTLAFFFICTCFLLLLLIMKR